MKEFLMSGILIIMGFMVLSQIYSCLDQREILSEGFNSCTPSYGIMNRSFWNPWLQNISYYFPYPYYLPFRYRNWGEVLDPYYPNYYQSYTHTFF